MLTADAAAFSLLLLLLLHPLKVELKLGLTIKLGLNVCQSAFVLSFQQRPQSFHHLLIVILEISERLVGVPHPGHQVSEGGGEILGVIVTCCILLLLKHFTWDRHPTKLRLDRGQSFHLQREPGAQLVKLLDLVLNAVGAVVLLLSVEQGHLLGQQKKAWHMEPPTAGIATNPPAGAGRSEANICAAIVVIPDDRLFLPTLLCRFNLSFRLILVPNIIFIFLG